MALLEPVMAPATSRRGGGATRGAARSGIPLTVLRPVGVLDEDVLGEIDLAMASAGFEPVVLDLTECTLTAPTVVAQLSPGRWGRAGADVCIVCRRLSGRRLLARAGVPLAVFHDVRDATQARLLDEAGYGTGWS